MHTNSRERPLDAYGCSEDLACAAPACWKFQARVKAVSRGAGRRRPKARRFGCAAGMIATALLVVCLAPLARAAEETRVAPSNYLSNIVADLRRDWPTNRTINIVCHGHSVPAGYFKTPVVDTFNAYPHLLHRGLNARFPHAVINVIVTAMGGENSESGARRFERDVLCHQPDIVTIDYGLNDRGIGLARAEAAWRAMIRAARERGIKVILLTPTADLAAKLDDPNDPLNQHAEQIRSLARQENVALVDSLAAFCASMQHGENLEGLMAQRNHPNRQGHDLVAAELLKWFSAPAPPSSSP